MFKFARAFWKVYYNDHFEQGSSKLFDDFEELKNELNMLRLWQRTESCHIDINVVLYSENIYSYSETVTIMGAL